MTDYIYFPLGGSRCSTVKTVRNIFIVWSISGLWHGANWTFVLWGLYQGLLFMPKTFGIVPKKRVEKHNSFGLPTLHSWLSIALVYLLIAFGWILFRADSLGHFLEILNSIIFNQDFAYAFNNDRGPWGASYLLVTILFMVILSLKDIKDAYLIDKIKIFNNSSKYVRWLAYWIISIIVYWYGISNTSTGSFIYFNF